MEGKLMHSILSTDAAYTISPEDFFKHLIKCSNTIIMSHRAPTTITKLEQNCGGNPDQFISSLFDTIDADDDWEYQFYHFVNISLRFDPVSINDRMFETENDMEMLKEDLLALVKLFFAFSDGSENCFETIGVDPDEWNPLKEKYCIELNDLAEIAWTYPYLSLMILKVYRDVERPVDMDLMCDYENFKPEFRFVGLLGLVPAQSKYGGFVKALLHYMVLQIFIAIEDHDDETHEGILKFVIGLARVFYHTGVRETCPRDEFIRFLGITTDDCLSWSEIFDRQYPGFADVHIKYFEQLE